MKNSLFLFTFIITLALFSSCQKEVSSDIQVKVDSILNKEHPEGTPLKITSSYTDSTGNVYLLGRKNKFWMGVFKKDSTEVFEKEFKEDPDSIVIDGSVIHNLDSLRIVKIDDLGEDLYIIRELMNKEEPLITRFYSIITKFNKKDHSIINKYSYHDTSGPIYLNVLDWGNEYILISAAEHLERIIIADRNMHEIEWYPAINFPTADVILQLSMYEYIAVFNTIIARRDMRSPDPFTGGYLWKTSIFTDIPDEDQIKILHKSIKGTILTVEAEITSPDSTKTNHIIKLDIGDGSIIN